VRSVPFETDPVALLEEAGLIGVRMLKFDTRPCFVRGGVGMRELRLEAFAPVPADGIPAEVMYLGPFCEIRDDAGRLFVRGARVRVPAAVAEQLRAPEFAGQFTVFEPTTTRPTTVTACSA
jgi:hypothetical protein